MIWAVSLLTLKPSRFRSVYNLINIILLQVSLISKKPIKRFPRLISAIPI